MAAAPSDISYISFSPLSSANNKKLAVVKLINSDLHDANGVPISSGLYDLRLGNSDHSFICATCEHGKKQCMGHRGYLELKLGFIQPIALAEVKKWLKIICLDCGGLIVDRSKYEKIEHHRRFSVICDVDTEGKLCINEQIKITGEPGSQQEVSIPCKRVHPKITGETTDNFTLWADFDISSKKVAKDINKNVITRPKIKLYPEMILRIFEKIPQDIVDWLGKPVHPKDFIIKNMNIPPNTIRPSPKSFAQGVVAQHDYTAVLQYIVRNNSFLQSINPKPFLTTYNSDVVEPIDLDHDTAYINLQLLYYDLIKGTSAAKNLSTTKGKKRMAVGQKQIESILSKLPTKEGRIRGNLLGKRTFNISRTTISGNSLYKIEEVGLPLSYAKTMQVKRVVQQFNVSYLMIFFNNKRSQYPGCTHIIKKSNGLVFDVVGLQNYIPEAGDIMSCDITDGDAIMFNRQPTLERSSMGVHYARVNTDPNAHTLQINVLACENYNADFDGDQMNATVAQSRASSTEVLILSSISSAFISPKSSGPLNGQAQDSILGLYKMTMNGVRLNKRCAIALFSGIDSPKFDKYPDNHIFTGRDIISMVLEPYPINYSGTPSSLNKAFVPYIKYDPKNISTTIVNGKLIDGVLDKAACGARSNGGIYHIISREYGSQAALDVIFAMQQVALRYLMYEGFTVCATDLLVTKKAYAMINNKISEAIRESEIISEKLIRGEIIAPIGKSVRQYYEEMQINALKADEGEIIRGIAESIDFNRNGFVNMVISGAKGKTANLLNVMGHVGQTLIGGGRIGETFAFRRTSAYACRFTTDPSAYGYITNSYINGLNMTEFVSQSISGRLDLITKALTTAVTGYFMRRGVMSNQSIVIDNHRCAVKDMKIVQFIYGDDGLDARYMEQIQFKTLMMDDETLKAHTYINADKGQTDKGQTDKDNKTHTKIQEVTDVFYQKLKAYRDQFRQSQIKLERSNFNTPLLSTISQPVNIGRIVESIMSKRKQDDIMVGTHTILKNIEYVLDISKRLPYILVNEIQERRRSRIPDHKLYASQSMVYQLLSVLTPKILSKLLYEELVCIIDSLREKYSAALVNYGSTVGNGAGQAISEPITQHMLNSHHGSIEGGSDASGGLTRLFEIFCSNSKRFEADKKMIIPLNKDMSWCSNPQDPTTILINAQEIADTMEYIVLKGILLRVDIILESYSGLVYPPYLRDIEWINDYKKYYPLSKVPSDLTNWCIRFEIDKSALILKALDLESVIHRLLQEHPEAYIVHTAESVPNIIIRMWVRNNAFKKDVNLIDRITEIKNEIMMTPIRGIEGIRSTRVEKTQQIRFDDAGIAVYDTRYVIHTHGSNLLEVCLHPAVDSSHVISNSLGDTEKVFGIVSTRCKIISETRTFMNEKMPNVRHVSLYADEMTRLGRTTNIERAGLKAREPNVLLQMAYGSPVQTITDAVINCSKNRVYGISSHMILGGVPKVGTTYNTLVVDKEFVKKHSKSINKAIADL